MMKPETCRNCVKTKHKKTHGNFCLGSELQFVLPVTWSYGRKYGVTLEQVASWWSDRPSKLAGLHSKVLNSNFNILYYS